MRPFKYTKALETTKAIEAVSKNKNAQFLAGGTNVIDLMKEDVARPDELVDINRLNLSQIKMGSDGKLSIGGLAKNTDTANHPLVRMNFPLLTQAILAGASAQIRNMATNGGNIMQRSRCAYLYDTSMACNKREPGSGCDAFDGINRMHAIFGWTAGCVCVHPSDMCVALAALDAVVAVEGKDGKTRTIPFVDFHRLPEDTPEIETNLNHGELITRIDIPKNNFAGNSYYLKVRDRASYAFALVSVAAGLEISGGVIRSARVAMGGVANKPWRAMLAEKELIGKKVEKKSFEKAAELEMAQAEPLEHNKFKVELGKRAIVRALTMATNGGKA